jgi:hypothetical protein
MTVAKDKLVGFGLTEGEIEKARDEGGEQKGKMVLRSRANGTVIVRNVVPGNFYEAKDKLLTIARMDPLWVRGRVSEGDAERVKLGQNVTVTFPFNDEQFRTKVEAVGAEVDHESHTVAIRTTIPNPDGRLRSGMFVRMAVETDTRDYASRERRGAVAGLVDADAKVATRLSELERKVERLLDGKEQSASHTKILERLDALERKLDRVLNGRD